MVIGGVGYVVLTFFDLMTQIFNVSFFSFATLAVALQVAVGLPVLTYLFMGAYVPILRYAKWLVALVAVLAISGNLGVETSGQAQSPGIGYAADMQGVREDMQDLEALELRVDLAGEEDEAERKELTKNIEDVRRGISAVESEGLKRQLDVLDGRRAIAAFEEPQRSANLAASASRQALVIMMAFMVLVGACLQAEEESGASESNDVASE
jgi:hypothetical protein